MEPQILAELRRRLVAALADLQPEHVTERPTRYAPSSVVLPGDEERYRAAERLIHDGREVEAFEVLKLLAEEGSGHWEVYNDLGCLFLAGGQTESALAALTAAVGLEGSDGQALANLARVYRHIGASERAFLAYVAWVGREKNVPESVKELVEFLSGWHASQVSRAESAASQVRGALGCLRGLGAPIHRPVPSLPLRFEPAFRRARPSILLYAPPASGSYAVSRILRKLCGEGYELVSPEYEGWAAAGGTPSSFSVDFEPEGKIYWWFTSEGMERALQSAGLQPAEFKWLLVVRDPRDVGVSLFHLAQDTGHMELARASATVYETHLRLAEEARSIGVDRYALDRASPGAEGLQRLQRLCERVPPHHVAFLSYALLCEEFPEFLKRLLAFAPFQPSPEQVEHLLETEDIRRPERLHATSLARAVMASPKPGRFRRELRPETIAEMNHRTAEARAWLASMEEPHLRHVYGD